MSVRLFACTSTSLTEQIILNYVWEIYENISKEVMCLKLENISGNF